MHEIIKKKNPPTFRAASYTLLCHYVRAAAVARMVRHPRNIWSTLVHWEPSEKWQNHVQTLKCKQSDQNFLGAAFTERLSSLSLQVIYKKFHIPCPFEEFSANNTGVHLLSTDLPLTDSHHDGQMVDDAHCSPHMFTVNSQVLIPVV